MSFPVFTVPAHGYIARDGQTILWLQSMRDPANSTRPILDADDLSDLTLAIARRLTAASLDRDDALLLARVLDPAFETTPADLAKVRAAVNFALQDSAGCREGAERRLAALTPDQRARHARDVAATQGVQTYQGYSCLAYVDRLGGVVITDTDDGRDTYVQPGDDAARLRAELDVAEATPEPTTAAGLGSHDLIQNILREYF